MVYPSPQHPVVGQAQAQVATAGEALFDLIEGADGRLLPCPGGAVYNLTRALGAQGVNTLYLNPLSQDRLGRQLARGLAEAGVTLAQPQALPHPTSLALASLDAAGKAHYSFYREGVADRQISAQSMTLACASSPRLQVVATGCLALMADDADRYQPWLSVQRRAGRLVVVDANLRLSATPHPGAYRQAVMAALQHAHLIKVSDDDLVALDLPGAGPMDQAWALLERTQADWLALTLGPAGACLLQRDGAVHHARDPLPVAVVDTVGAGDCFLAGLLAALLATPPGDTGGRHRLLNFAQAPQVLGQAVASASLCVAQAGCVPPSHTAVRARLDASQKVLHPV